VLSSAYSPNSRGLGLEVLSKRYCSVENTIHDHPDIRLGEVQVYSQTEGRVDKELLLIMGGGMKGLPVGSSIPRASSTSEATEELLAISSHCVKD
jgi:hypothetical protein